MPTRMPWAVPLVAPKVSVPLGAIAGWVTKVSVPVVFVIGHDTYYPKFGFTVAETEKFQTPLKGPHFFAVRLRFGPPMSGELMFPRAFGVPRA